MIPDKCAHVCSKSGKPCESNAKLTLAPGVGYCPQHYTQAKQKQGTDEVPDLFAVKEKE